MGFRLLVTRISTGVEDGVLLVALDHSRRVEVVEQHETQGKELFWSWPSSSSTPKLMTSSGVGDAGTLLWRIDGVVVEDGAEVDRWIAATPGLAAAAAGGEAEGGDRVREVPGLKKRWRCGSPFHSI